MKIQYPVRKNTLSSEDKYSKQWRQIQFTVTANTISNHDKCYINFRQIQYPGKTNTNPVKTNTIFCYDKYNIHYR